MVEEMELSPEVYQLLADGHKIEAIKLIREETGVGLAEAKEIADAISGHELSGSLPPPGMTEEGGAGGLLAIVVAILIAGLVYFFFIGD